MNLALIIFWILTGYFFVVFVVLRLVVPFMGFGKFKMPKEIPEEIKNKIAELELASTSQKDYLQAAYNFVVNRWQAGRMDTVVKAPLAFRKNLSSIWNSPGYAHCNTQNYILFVLLAGSKFFKPEDVESKCVFFNFFIHQYLKINIDNQIVDADPAGASIRGEPLGQHIEFFG